VGESGVVVAVLVRDEGGGDVARVEARPPVQLPRHLLRVGHRRIDEQPEITSAHKGASADHRANAPGVRLAPVAVAREVADRDDIPPLHPRVGPPLPQSRSGGRARRGAARGHPVGQLRRDFFRDRRGFYNAVDFEQSARTMDKLAAMGDIIVPGHDNYFLVG
jgi:hypothetical protein